MFCKPCHNNAGAQNTGGGEWVSTQGRQAVPHKGEGELTGSAAAQHPHLAGLFPQPGQGKGTRSVSSLQINVSESLRDAVCGAHGCSA